LAREGATVNIVDIDDEGGQRVAGEINRTGGKAGFYHLDVSREHDVEKVFTEICEKSGKLDVLVNCAGIVGSDAPPHEITNEQWDYVMNTNLKGPFFLAQLAANEMIRASLEKMLGRVRPRGYETVQGGPSVAVLLDVDREYRDKAAAGTLPTIAPRRFNPKNESWLPILHTERDEWHFTALFSNTGRAHDLGRTRDWVVIYFYNDHHEEGQHTIVTETRGPLVGSRVVRGREDECRDFYAS
jgi:hypothetical protein